jgi:hypothetical protein
MTKEQDRILGNVESIFLPHLTRIFEANLAVAMLYGSAVKGTFTDGMSDVNILVLLQKADPASVIQLGKKARSCMRKNRINPLLLTEEEYLASADVFPLEYLDIADSRKVIHGDDPTKKLDITRANLRHQVEAQLRGTIADLRRALLASSGRERLLRRHLKEWFGSQNALLRGLLRLGGGTAIPADVEVVAQMLGDQYGIDAAVIVELSRIRSGEKLDAAGAVERSLSYLTELARNIDSMEV